MNPTQKQDNHGPDHPTRLWDIVGQFIGRDRFRSWLATAGSVLAGPAAHPDDRFLITDYGRQALVATEQTVGRVCRNCGDPMQGWYSCDEPLCPSCVTFLQGHPGETPTGTVQLASAGGRCLRCGAAGHYPCCQQSVNGNWSCADLAGIAEATVDRKAGGSTDESQAPGTAALVLRLAAKYLELHGWIQGAYYDGTTGVFTPPADMVGAIAMVCYGGPCEAPAQHFDDPGFLDFEEAVLHLDRFLLVEDGSESYEFNDARGRRLADVTRVLRDAASRPAHELVDALQAMSDGYSLDKWMADRARLLTPRITLNGYQETGCPCCVSTDPTVREAIDYGDGPTYCDHEWHDGGSDGGDAE